MARPITLFYTRLYFHDFSRMNDNSGFRLLMTRMAVRLPIRDVAVPATFAHDQA